MNQSGSTAYYKYIVVDESGQTDTVDIELLGIKGENTATLFLGFGHRWYENQIMDYVNSIERIELRTVNDTTVLNDKKKMYDLFQDHRKGVFKRTVKIKLK